MIKRLQKLKIKSEIEVIEKTTRIWKQRFKVEFQNANSKKLESQLL